MTQEKSKGDIGEDFVNDLAFTSYLKYWCYPNPMDENGDKKEICDLLIVFKNYAIIISVKNYDNKGNYDRYKRRVIEKSTKQLYGAERKLFNSNSEVFIKHPNRPKERFNPSKFDKVYRITVNVGEQFEYYDFGDNKENKGFISILNKNTFQIITQELDTISDLVEYLDEREKLLTQSAELKINCSEIDLLAVFLKNRRTFPDEYHSDKFQEKSFDLKGAWENYDKSKSVALKREENKASYFIDHLVKTDVLKLPNGEVLAKELMSLSRTERRMMSKSLFSLIGKYENTEIELGRRYSVYNGIGFLLIYYAKEIDENLVDWTIQQAMPIYCYKRGLKEKEIIVLAATDNLKQWKFGMFKQTGNQMTDQEINYYDGLIEKFGWFKDMKMMVYEEKEYPDEE